jgi:hypothetical protein
MPRLATLLVILGLAFPSHAEDKKVTVRFLGGTKKVPLDGLKVTIRKYTGHFTDDHKVKALTNAKTDKAGAASFALPDGRYYVEIDSDKELPYLNIPVGYKEYPGYYDRFIEVGKETAFEFNLADACKLTLRAVDADTGKGISGVPFMMESQTLEYLFSVSGDNLGVGRLNRREDVTDKDGYLIRYMEPHDGYSYFAWPQPKGYEAVGVWTVTIPTPLGKEKAEHVFKFKKK